MRVVIIEDEKPAAERLQSLLAAYDPSIEVAGCCESIEESVQWLATRRHPDLLLVDIHLSDGQSFDIFRQVEYNNPIIFTTAYDDYVLDAFRYLSIDYILKPVSQQALAKALTKFKSLAASFSSSDFTKAISGWEPKTYKERFLGKIGQRLFFIDVNDIAFFRADNKIVFLTDKEGTRYIVDYRLDKLEQLLNPKKFFRVNRSYFVHQPYIRQIKSVFNNRLRLIIAGAAETEEIVISRDRVAEFKSWADG